MVKKEIVLLFLVILIVPLISSSLGTSKINECVDIKVPVNATSVNLSSLSFPNFTIILYNQAMEKHGLVFNYTFCSPPVQGEYYFTYNDEKGNVYSNSFFVNSAGSEFTVPRAILSTAVLSFFIFFFLLVMWFISKLPNENDADTEEDILSYNKLKYLKSALLFVEWTLFLAMIYIVSNLSFAFLGEELMAKTLFTFFLIGGYITPVIIIIWFVWILSNIIRDKKFKRMIQKGIYTGRHQF